MKTTTKIIVDLSVVAHNLHPLIEKHYRDTNLYRGLIASQVLSLMNPVNFESISKGRDIEFIWVADSKPYWRTEYLLRPDIVVKVPRKKKALELKRQELQGILDKLPTKLSEAEINEASILTSELGIHYKAGRTFPAPSFTKLKKLLRSILSSYGISVLASHGLEADDLAATCVKLCKPDDELVLLTVDSDWLGLLQDNVQWVCATGYQPRVRAWSSVDKGVNANLDEWSLRRLKSVLEVPRAIWDIKQSQGDKSDNLPPGSPIEVIDLLQPPEVYAGWNIPQLADMTEVLLSSTTPRNDLFAGINRAEDYLARIGIPRVLKPI